MSFENAATNRKLVGVTNYQSGLAAETSVERACVERGAVLVERRWRGAAGEVDLILRDGDELVFVEVKKSKDFARAAERVSKRQLARIATTAEEYLGRQPQGSLTPMRIDVALVNDLGEVEILRNVMLD